MKKASELNVKGTAVRVVKIGGEDFVCLTDMAKSKSDDAQQTISHWMRNRMTIEYLGLWESLYNPSFKPLEFEGFRKEVGLNSFTMSPSKWIEGVNAIGMVVQAGRYGGTYVSFVPDPLEPREFIKDNYREMYLRWSEISDEGFFGSK